MNRKLVFTLLASPIFTLGLAQRAEACTPYGLIGQKYAQPQIAAALGPCVNDEGDDGAGGRIEEFQNGAIDWDGHSNEAFAVYGLIHQKWAKQGGPVGFGHPTTDETDSGTGRGRYNLFDKGGSILWLRGTNEAFPVFGVIRLTYNAEQDEFGDLGFPTSDELPLGNNGSRFNYFEHGWITWNPNGETDVHVYNQRFTYRLPQIGFGGGDPVGAWNIAVSIYSNGNYNFTGHFHNASSILNPTLERDALVFIFKSHNGAAYTFAHNGSTSVLERDDNINDNGNNPKLASGWADLEAGPSVDWQASTQVDLILLANNIKAAIGYVASVIQVAGPIIKLL
jgi:uncharacterized protein with LGFP repeats